MSEEKLNRPKWDSPEMSDWDDDWDDDGDRPDGVGC